MLAYVGYEAVDLEGANKQANGARKKTCEKERASEREGGRNREPRARESGIEREQERESANVNENESGRGR